MVEVLSFCIFTKGLLLQKNVCENFAYSVMYSVYPFCIKMIFFSQGGTILGEATQVINLGETFIPYQVFLEYVLGLGETTFR